MGFKSNRYQLSLTKIYRISNESTTKYSYFMDRVLTKTGETEDDVQLKYAIDLLEGKVTDDAFPADPEKAVQELQAAKSPEPEKEMEDAH